VFGRREAGRTPAGRSSKMGPMADAATTTGAAAALERRARDLDAADPLRAFRERFVAIGDDAGIVAYLDGNSLGRPPRTTPELLERFVRETWGGRLIRGWDEGWMELGQTIGDRLGRVVLGAGPGQVVVADSTTVMLYKLARAAVAARGGRREIVLDTDNFPTDRYVLEGIAAERDLELRWVETDPSGGITPDQVAAAVGPDTALVVFSHVAYRSAHLADAGAITRIAHAAGALALWDVSHSAGSVEVMLDDWGADLAVGCTYKYLNGGPGSPAFGYVRAEHQDTLQQPIWGWLGRRDPFTMGPGYDPAAGLQSVVSGTPPILGMLPLAASLDLIEEAGMPAIRAKSVALTEFALEAVEALLAPHGARVVSPRESASRGGHVTVRHPAFRDLMGPLWARGVIADFREPESIRIGLSPLSTSFAEAHRGLTTLATLLGEAVR
jgi:kynureninase